MMVLPPQGGQQFYQAFRGLQALVQHGFKYVITETDSQVVFNCLQRTYNQDTDLGKSQWRMKNTLQEISKPLRTWCEAPEDLQGS